MASHYLLLFVGLAASLFVVSAVGRRAHSWTLVGLACVVGSVAGYIVDRDRAGYIVGAAFALFVICPALGMAEISRLLASRRYAAAKGLARIVAVLHPFGAQRGWIEIVTAWQLASAGKLDEAEALLRASSQIAADDCVLEILRLRHRWDDVVANIAARGEAAFDTGLSVVLLRAFGELGDARMLEAYKLLAASRKPGADGDDMFATAQLFTSAFLGNVALVDALYKGVLAHFHPSTKAFWRATAMACAGDRDAANAIFAQLATDDDWRTRAGAQHRLAHPPIAADPRGHELIVGVADTLRDAAMYGERANAGAPRAVLPYVLAALVTVIHLVALIVPDIVYEHGMYWSPAVLVDHQWWRIGTAMLLHNGWFHLGMNVFALVWFGPFVERTLGRPRFALVAIAGGCGAFALIALLDALDLRDPSAALGASGAVMALVGASIAIFVRGSLGDRSPIARTRLRNILVFVAVQSVFDALAPQVSMTGHLGGLVIGFVLALPRRRT